MSADRRRTPRLQCDLPVQWKRGWRDVLARACDMNADGIFIRTDETVELNHMVDVTVTLPTGKVTFMGVARFVGATRHGRGIGVSIHVISKEDRERWSAFYQSKLRDLVDAMPAAVSRHLAVR